MDGLLKTDIARIDIGEKQENWGGDHFEASSHGVMANRYEEAHESTIRG